MHVSKSSSSADEITVLEHLLAGGEMVAAQLPSASCWSPEKRLAGAVLMSALVEVRDHHHEPHYRRRVAEDIAWICSDDVDWPFSFVRLCQLFGLDAQWVREVVGRWLRDTPGCSQRRYSPHRHAA